MERTNGKKLQALSAIVTRMQYASMLGLTQYGGDRDVYQALGYKEQLTFNDYLGRYIRQDIAKAIIDRPVKATWQGSLELIESEDFKDSKFEKAWDDLNYNFSIKDVFSRVDRLTGLGKFGIILLGLSDVSAPTAWVRPARKGVKLKYLRAFSSGSVEITTYEQNTSSERFGKPLIYTIKTRETGIGSDLNIQVHFSRVVHIVDDPLESDTESSPRLEVVFNRLMDLEKLIGGDAEMFWRGARPGYAGKLDEGYKMSAEMEDDLKAQIDEYEHNLRRVLVNTGVEYKALAQQVAEPAQHVAIQIQMISAVTGIPNRILIGSERGELSSAQDAGEWKIFVQTRRDDYAEPRVIRPFVKKCIELGILPEPESGKYTTKWSDLFAMSELDRVKVGESRANALKSYTASPLSETIMDPDSFMKLCMGLNETQEELVRQNRGSGILQEQVALQLPIQKQPAAPIVKNPSMKRGNV